MTDVVETKTPPASFHTSDAQRERLARRYRQEAWFKRLGGFAVCLALSFLAFLVINIISNAYKAFSYNYLTLPVTFNEAEIDPEQTDDLAIIGKADFGTIGKNALRELFPFIEGRRQRRTLYGLLTSDLGLQLRNAVLDDPDLIGKTVSIPVQLDDMSDLYFKDDVTAIDRIEGERRATPTGTSGEIEITLSPQDLNPVRDAVLQDLQRRVDQRVIKGTAKERARAHLLIQIDAVEQRLSGISDPLRRDQLSRRLSAFQEELRRTISQIETEQSEIAALQTRMKTDPLNEALNAEMSSFIIKINGGAVKVTRLDDKKVTGDVIVPLNSVESAEAGDWTIEILQTPQDNRRLDDRSIIWLDYLADQGFIESRFNAVFFTSSASREPEQAGILGAVIGSAITMLVTLFLSFPLGVSAAIYLEEFAPKNWFTRLIEVNINNLAAVPSIVFGLLGLAVFLNLFGLPRSAPLVGGMVLALMTLPTIIIASRAALRSVPPSIREAALGIGASKLQMVIHHVLPLAMPGILTGTIIGMAQALGETAPLLMIGMVAFIVDVPGGPLDPATVLPVQIFMWADFPEPAFQQKTSAAILILLAFLIFMNALAVLLRKRFERRW